MLGANLIERENYAPVMLSVVGAIGIKESLFREQQSGIVLSKQLSDVFELGHTAVEITEEIFCPVTVERSIVEVGNICIDQQREYTDNDELDGDLPRLVRLHINSFENVFTTVGVVVSRIQTIRECFSPALFISPPVLSTPRNVRIHPVLPFRKRCPRSLFVGITVFLSRWIVRVGIVRVEIGSSGRSSVVKRLLTVLADPILSCCERSSASSGFNKCIRYF